MTTTTNKGAWTCNHCRATNVSARCGCMASRLAAGQKPVAEISVDDIHLDIAPRKARRLRG